MERQGFRNLVLTAMFFGIGLILPFITGQIPTIGKMMLPMHIPVFLCGLICGWQYGLVLGIILPLIRSVLFLMPVMYPSAISMAFELATYGFTVGFLYSHIKRQCIKSLYVCMLISMISGRLVAGVVKTILLGLQNKPYTFASFISSSLLGAVPGIIVQLILIPAIMIALNRAKLMIFNSNK